MELYLLKSAACLLLFFGFYKLVLEGTSIHLFKRFYLLTALVVSFGIPFIVFTNYVEVPVQAFSHQVSILNTEMIPEETSPLNNAIPIILWTIYSLGVFFFGIRFGLNMFQIFRRIRKNPLHKNNNFIAVLLNLPTIPHTFFQYIFLNKESFENKTIPQEVIWHEETHARELHSLDIVLIEFLHVVFWFNPLLYFFKKTMKLNHEFLADQSVLQKGINTTTYQKILLAFSSNAHVPALAHAINYSFIKKRFTVMKTQTSKKAIWLKTLLILPLLVVSLYSFSTKKTLEIFKESTIAGITKEAPITIKISGNKVSINGKESSIVKFAKDLDAITKNWKKKDFSEMPLDIIIDNPEKGFIAKLETEYKKSQLYKNSPNKESLVPPPPPKPNSNNVFIEKEIEEIETPSPNIEEEIEFYNEFLGPNTPPPPPAPDAPPALNVVETPALNDVIPVPDPVEPPPAPNTLDFVIKMAKKGATFYLDGSKIS
ncbi:MAG: M56 family metallopeptidase, partial [Flavobacteriaceae bacterium]|nr:M56 family metallopeptidase [Flavobacteriaceae bacterium]